MPLVFLRIQLKIRIFFLHLLSLLFVAGFACVLCSSRILHLTAKESSYSSKALLLLESNRASPAKPPSEDASPKQMPFQGQVYTHSPKYHEMAEQKDISAGVSYICTGDFAGIGMMGVLFFARRDLAYKPIVLFCSHYYKPVRNGMRLSVSCGESSENSPTPQRA